MTYLHNRKSLKNVIFDRNLRGKSKKPAEVGQSTAPRMNQSEYSLYLIVRQNGTDSVIN